MDPLDPQPPQPPRPIPPAPPSPEWLKRAPASGASAMMGFFQRRMENLERELALERERATTAQNLLSQQDVMRGEVDTQLKALTDQIRREKAERESDETRSHARGRIETLEKRLDDMGATFSSLLKEAVAGRNDGPSAAALAAELAAFRGALKDSMDGVDRWRGELRELSALVPQVQDIAERLPAEEKLLEQNVGRRLDEFAQRVANDLEEWKRAQASGRSALEAQTRALREEQSKERAAAAADLSRQLAQLSARLPADEKAFEESIGRRLDEFASRMARALDDWQRVQESSRAALDGQVEAAARERADLARAWESQARILREEQFKDRVSREAEVSRQVGELSARLAELTSAQQGTVLGQGTVREGLDRVIAILTATPKAKDAVILELEAEKLELVKVLRDRQETLRRFVAERRDVEKSMGDALVQLTAQLEEERAKARRAEARANEHIGQAETLQARGEDLTRAVQARDERIRLLAEERDELVRSLVAEAEKSRLAIEERRDRDDASESVLLDLRRRLDEELQRRTAAEGAAVDSRAQMAALAEQAARAFSERDSTLARFTDWEKERQRLTEALRKKDEMISLLSSTIQGSLKKSG